MRLLRAALSLWRGTPLTGATAAFVESAQARLEEQQLSTYERLAEAELARLEGYFDLRRMYAERSEINSQVLELCEATGNLRGQATMLRGLIEVKTWTNPEQHADAMAALLADATRLFETFAAVDEDRGVADVLVLCSWAHTAKGAYGEAMAAGERRTRPGVTPQGGRWVGRLWRAFRCDRPRWRREWGGGSGPGGRKP